MDFCDKNAVYAKQKADQAYSQQFKKKHKETDFKYVAAFCFPNWEDLFKSNPPISFVQILKAIILGAGGRTI